MGRKWNSAVVRKSRGGDNNMQMLLRNWPSWKLGFVKGRGCSKSSIRWKTKREADLMRFGGRSWCNASGKASANSSNLKSNKKKRRGSAKRRQMRKRGRKKKDKRLTSKKRKSVRGSYTNLNLPGKKESAKGKKSWGMKREEWRWKGRDAKLRDSDWKLNGNAWKWLCPSLSLKLELIPSSAENVTPMEFSGKILASNSRKPEKPTKRPLPLLVNLRHPKALLLARAEGKLSFLCSYFRGRALALRPSSRPRSLLET